jgi:hypothetical protein
MSTQQASTKFYVDIQAGFRLNAILSASSEKEAAEVFLNQLREKLGCDILVSDCYVVENPPLPGFDDEEDE